MQFKLDSSLHSGEGHGRPLLAIDVDLFIISATSSLFKVIKNNKIDIEKTATAITAVIGQHLGGNFTIQASLTSYQDFCHKKRCSWCFVPPPQHPIPAFHPSRGTSS